MEYSNSTATEIYKQPGATRQRWLGENIAGDDGQRKLQREFFILISAYAPPASTALTVSGPGGNGMTNSR
jgi:hypothetical protein